MRIEQIICDLCGQEVQLARVPANAVLNPDQLELPITYNDYAGTERQVCVTVSWKHSPPIGSAALADRVELDYHPDCLARLMHESVVNWAEFTGQLVSTNADPRAHLPAAPDALDGSGAAEIPA